MEQEIRRLEQALIKADRLAQTGDQQAAQDAAILARELRRLMGIAQPTAAPVAGTQAAVPEQPTGGAWWENIIARGAADTPGERMAPYVRGVAPAIARGMADAAALPVNLAQLGTTGVEWLFGMEQPSAVSRTLEGLPDTRDMLASVPLIGPETQYEAPGRLGQYIATTGEMTGGAAGMGVKGLRNLLQYGAAPGVASEALGQFPSIEGTNVEPWARAIGALAAPSGVGLAANVITPSPGTISPERAQAIATLRQEGITPTAGQATRDTFQLAREAASRRGVALADKAADDYTAAIMRSLGSDSRLATPEALRQTQQRLSEDFKRIGADAEVVPSQENLVQMADAIANYEIMTPATEVVPLLKSVNNALVAAYQKGEPIPNDVLMSWRSNISALTASGRPPQITVAHEALDVLDDAIANALIQAGRGEEVQQLQAARSQWRNLLAVEASARTAGFEGVLSPLAMRQALMTQGRRAYLQGQRDIAPVTMAAASLMKPLEQSGTQPRQAAQQFLSGATGGAGVGLGAFGLGLDPVTSAAVGGTVAMMPGLRNAFLSSPAGQRYYQNQLIPENTGGPWQMTGTLPGLMNIDQNSAPY